MIPGISAGIGFLSVIFGGKENAVQPLKFEGELSLSGTITTPSPVYSLLLRLPGADTSDEDDGALSCSDSKLGIFNLNKPVFAGLCEEDCYNPGNSGWHWVCESSEDVSLESLEITLNPKIASFVTQVRAGRIPRSGTTEFHPMSSFENVGYYSSWYSHIDAGLDGFDGVERQKQWTDSLAIEITIQYNSEINPIVIATAFKARIDCSN